MRRRRTDSGRGIVQAFDARTGARRWSFEPLPDSASHAAAGDWQLAEATRAGGANPWGVMSVDENRGLVFVATGSARPQASMVADASATIGSQIHCSHSTRQGVVSLWQQQLVHHDLWDYDLAAEPALIDVSVHGVSVSAVLQATKSGMLFLFERGTGKPIAAIAERPVPQSAIPTEEASPTQPFPATPPLVEQRPLMPSGCLGPHILGPRCLPRTHCEVSQDGLFTPPDPRGSILRPGVPGGVGWGGVAFDAHHQHVFAAVNHLPMLLTLIPPDEREEFKPLLSPWGLPCTAPPWGTLVNVDLRRNRIAWQVPLGSTEGTLPVVSPRHATSVCRTSAVRSLTAGDLVFVAAAADSYLRAFDMQTGRELWKHRLPAGGQATPMTYRAGKSQRQYLVISAGGHGGLGTRIR